MNRSFDAIIIGAGQGGPTLAGRFSAAGMKVALAERNLFGGTCVNTGCTPTKTMVASAYAAHLARRGSEFGVQIDGTPRVDMRRVKTRKDAIVEESRAGLVSWLKSLPNCTIIEDHARFESPRELRIGSETFSADRIFINVGGRAAVPPMPGLDQVAYFTNSSLLEVDFVPPHLIVVGGSYVGLEFAQIFRRFGSEVTVIEMGPRLVRREDEDISDAIRQFLEAEGIRVRLDAKCISFLRRDQQSIAHLDCATGERDVHGTHVLLAVGRVPNTGDLGLQDAGVKTNERGYIVVDDELRTNVSGIWALGDCNGRGAFTHTAFNDAEIIAANLIDGESRRVSDRIPAYALYTDPPLGRVGLTATEVAKTGRRALVGTRPMTNVKRAVEKGETAGFMKVVVDAETRAILGAAILGTGGDEVIHSIIDVMYAKAPYTVIQRAVHIHPTVSELIPTMLGELQPLDRGEAERYMHRGSSSPTMKTTPESEARTK